MKKRIYSLGAVVYDHLINIESIPKKPIKVKGNEYTTRLGGPAAVASIFLSSHGVDSKFIGKNFVFDYRMSEEITADVISNCHQCNEPSSRHTNCANQACHILFIQYGKLGSHN